MTVNVLGRLRRLSQRFGIAAPRVSVRSDVAWYWRWLGLIVVAVAGLTLAVSMYEAGRQYAGFDRQVIEQQMHDVQLKLVAARHELRLLQAETQELRAVSNAAGSRIAIERVAQQKLTEQIRTLGRENARLREELGTFESMLSSDARPTQPLSINRFKIEPEVLPGEYRYRLLLLTSGSRRDREFEGRLELVVTVIEDGKSVNMSFPGKDDAQAAAFGLAFKNFRRVEGIFRVNPKAKLQSAQARIYEAGSNQPKVTKNATIDSGGTDVSKSQ